MKRLVKKKAKFRRVRTKRDPLRLGAEDGFAKVQLRGLAVNGNFPAVKPIAGVVEVEELVRAVVRAAILPWSFGYVAAAIEAAIGGKL